MILDKKHYLVEPIKDIKPIDSEFSNKLEFVFSTPNIINNKNTMIIDLYEFENIIKMLNLKQYNTIKGSTTSKEFLNLLKKTNIDLNDYTLFTKSMDTYKEIFKLSDYKHEKYPVRKIKEDIEKWKNFDSSFPQSNYFLELDVKSSILPKGNGYEIEKRQKTLKFNEYHQLNDLLKDIIKNYLKIKNIDIEKDKNYFLYISSLDKDVSLYKKIDKLFIGQPKQNKVKTIFSYEIPITICSTINNMKIFKNKTIPKTNLDINKSQVLDYWKNYNIVKNFSGKLSFLNSYLNLKPTKENLNTVKIELIKNNKLIAENYNDINYYTDNELKNLLQKNIKKTLNEIVKNKNIKTINKDNINR